MVSQRRQVEAKPTSGMSWIWSGSGLVLGALGLAVSGVLLQHHVTSTIGGDPMFAEVCEDEATSASCDEVIASAWGTMFGQPTAWWGFVFFAFMVSWYLVVGRPLGSARGWWNVVPLGTAAAGTLACAWFAWVMYVQLENWCPLCAVTHVLTFLLLVVAAVALRGSWRVDPHAGSAFLLRRAGVAVVLAAVTSALGWSEYHRRLEQGFARAFEEKYEQAARYEGELEEYEADYRRYYQQFASQKRHAIKLDDDESIRGNPEAPHTVVIFSDFECPACRAAELFIDRQMEEYPDLFHVVFKHFPFDQTCNKHVTRTLHRAACAAAVTAEAARKIKGDEAFWEFHDAFFANQKDFPARMQRFVNETAEGMGITEEELWRHINTTAAWERINRHVAQAAELGINRTPMIYFDGRPLARWADPLFWRYLKKVDERAGEPVIPPDTQPAAATPEVSPADEAGESGEDVAGQADSEEEAGTQSSNGPESHEGDKESSQ